MKLTEEEIRKLGRKLGAVEAYDKIVADYKESLGDWTKDPNWREIAQEMGDYFTFAANTLRDELEVEHQRKLAKIDNRFWHRMAILVIVFVLIQAYVWMMLT
jgi:hypothetical protein